VFPPYAGVSTAILLFTKNRPWRFSIKFYDMSARVEPRPTSAILCSRSKKLGPAARKSLYKKASTPRTTLPDALARWEERTSSRAPNGRRTEQSFCVPRAEIVPRAMTSAFNRYKELNYEEGGAPACRWKSWQELRAIEQEILQGNRGGWRGCSDEPIPSPTQGQAKKHQQTDRLRRITSSSLRRPRASAEGGSWPRGDFVKPSATRCFQAVLLLWVPPTPETQEIGVVGGDQTGPHDRVRAAKGVRPETITTAGNLSR